MKKLILAIIFICSTFIVFGQSVTENYILSSLYQKKAYGTYQDYTIGLSTSDLLLNGSGGAGGSFSITNNEIKLSFSGSWSSSSNKLKVGVIKSLSTSPILPDMELGEILSGGTSIGYLARIKGGNLEFYSRFYMTGVNTSMNASIAGGSTINFSTNLGTLYECGSSGSGGGGGTLSILNGNVSLSMSGGWDPNCNLKLGNHKYLSTSTIPNTELGVIVSNLGVETAYKAKIQNNWLVFYTDENIPSPSSGSISSISNLGIGENDLIKTVTYFDGLGRAKQAVNINAGGNSEDIITHIEYDEYGRQSKDFLPYSSELSKASYRTNALSQTGTYYNTTKYENTVNPFSEKLFETTPLSRVKVRAAPGNDWAIGNGHEIKFEYNTNVTSEVRKYYVTLNSSNIPDLNTTGYYTVGTLYKTITKDENWISGTNHTTEEFKNEQGQIVLKRSYNDGIHDTFYVYDDYGNLTYVLPPLSDPNNSKPISTVIFELCYQYKYDLKNRLIEKKIPGKGNPNDLTSGWEYIVYNKLDQPILTQDPNLKAQNKWLFTKYDAFGRVVYTGIMSRNATRATLQSEADSYTSYPLQYEKTGSSIVLGGGTVSYTNTAYPKNNITELHTVNYYDTYLDSNGMSVPAMVYSKPKATSTKGLATVSKVRVLGEIAWITTIMGYDAKGNIIYSKSSNSFLNSTDENKNKLDFVGKLLESTTVHTRSGQPTITNIDKFTYDHVGRLKKQTQKVNTNPEELIAENTYDELGQLQAKKVGGSANGVGLQNMDYSYNVRGWLKQINNPANLGTDLFSFELSYNSSKFIGSVPLYNGNISETIWLTANDKFASTSNSSRGYNYKYDNLNRLIDADYFKNSANTIYNKYDFKASYDKNGNIKTLSRGNGYGTIDGLQYTYNYNQLLKVVDNGYSGSKADGFVDGTNTGNDYAYDTNGNMTSDLNKGIPTNGITYNHLNLPTSVTLPGGTISYIYDATGVKQRKVAAVTTTDYAGNYIYQNGSLEFFNHSEGYVEYDGGSFNYVYNYTDHLGNIRLSYTDANGNGAIDASSEIIEENNYYPFGLQHKGYNIISSPLGSSAAKKYKFGGKELQEEHGLDWYDISARNYDPALGRWMNLDPLAELMRRHSPYNYAFNNPLVFTDPDGMAPFTDLFDKNGKKLGSDGVDNGVNVVVNNDDLAKQVEAVNKQDGSVDLLDDQFSFGSADITVLPDEGTLKESINVLDRTVDNGGLKEESSKVIDFGKRVSRSKTGTAPTVASNGEGGFVATAETKAEAAPLLGNEQVTALIHSHPTTALEAKGQVFPFSANTPSGVDIGSFKNQSTNIIVGPISGNVTRNASGTLNDNRTLGISIFNNRAQLQISLSKKTVNKIIGN